MDPFGTASMKTGTIVSGAGHVLLIGFVLFGGLFAREPLPPPETADVQIISEEEFAALTRPTEAEIQGEAPQTSEAPEALPEVEAPDAEPQAPAPEDQPEAPASPEPAPEAPDAPDPAPETPQPTPEAEVGDAAPEAPAPPPADDTLPPAPQEVPRPADRVTPDPTPPPPPEADEAPEIAETTTPEPSETPDPVEEQEPAAPEESAPEIVTEAEEPAAREDESELTARAPTDSPRPRTRPERPARTAEAEPAGEETPTAPQTEGTQTEAASDNVQAAIDDALAGLEGGGAPEPDIAAGPPISSGDRNAFILAVRRCWIVDQGSRAADVTVSIRFEMTREGKVVGGSLEQVSAEGGPDSAIRAAFDAGRRAILRCQNEGDGYQLPPESYGRWREVIVTFNPTEMRMR